MKALSTKRISYIVQTFVPAMVACLASATAILLHFPVWAMFIGWIGFFTKGMNTQAAIENMTCLWLGLILGYLASLAIYSLVPTQGLMVALPSVVIVVATLVISLRGLPILNNLLCYFLGLVAWFAAHLDPKISSLGILAGSVSLGILAGLIAHMFTAKITPYIVNNS
ncbi:DUF1097 domain-containing protein [Marinomonas sp. GJ51-6]|uniref:DUF1097 domain-containing protein n=1 Tax=Marinomonas sp. GJ51-6 TaxID=2992802 RepID=UPI00293519E8|nr:DUF1097 domain-containing protein [Marinomonas sp. GJ51-6]WOD08447.1 DUF1097 domain-containing protein [Marinomonas sp. GJ51-6]